MTKLEELKAERDAARAHIHKLEAAFHAELEAAFHATYAADASYHAAPNKEQST